MQAPLELDRWNIMVTAGPDGGNAASCSAMPEYMKATIRVDPDQLETGDELDEDAAHEMAHCHTWPISHVADDLAVALCELLPEGFILPFAKLLKASVERAEETTTTQVGRTYIKLLRQVWASEKEIAALKAEVRQLKKAQLQGG